MLTANDLYIFAHASGNLNPMHMPETGGDDEAPHEIVAPSMWVGALVSSVLGNILPGAGTLYKAQTFAFFNRAHVGDELTVTVRVREKRADNVVVLDTKVTGRGSDPIAEGIAEVLAPSAKSASKRSACRPCSCNAIGTSMRFWSGPTRWSRSERQL